MIRNLTVRLNAAFRVGILFLVLSASACTGVQPTPVTLTEPVQRTATPTLLSTPAAPAAGWKPYENAAFGLRLQYPPDWFGPEEYVSNPTLRLEIGSDKVYPYGTSPEDRTSTVKNSYSVVIQYTQNINRWTLDQYRAEQPWLSPFLQLLGQKDGEKLEDPKGVMNRVRAVEVGKFEGLETLSAPADTAGGEYFYVRQVVLMDDALNVLSILGSPNNVEAGSSSLPDAYRQVDEANLGTFRRIVESISIQ